MHTKTVIAIFLRQRFRSGQLVAARLAKAIRVSPTLLSEVLAGTKDFPMKRLDETARFFRFDDPIDFIKLARAEVDALRRGESPAEAEARIREMAARARALEDEVDTLTGDEDDGEDRDGRKRRR